jgi:ribonuclease P protein component
MLPRDLRLRANRDFQKVYGEGRSWAHPLLALHVLPQPEGQRIGFSVSRKVGKAVVRNRTRRRAREAVRAQIGSWKTGFDCVMVLRAAAAEAEFADLRAAIEELARRARLPREPGEGEDAHYTLPAGGRPARKA